MRSPSAMVRSATLFALVLLAGCASAAPAGPVESGARGEPTCGCTLGVCPTGKRQSPVDLVSPGVEGLPEMRFSYGRDAMRLFDVGHEGHHEAQAGYAPGFAVGDQKWFFAQLHYHVPSEHRLPPAPGAPAEALPMEIHLVHTDVTGKRGAVIGLLVKIGRKNEALQKILDAWGDGKGAPLLWSGFPLEQLLPESRRTFRYEGSLTTSPFCEGIQWFVMATPIEMSKEQEAGFKKSAAAAREAQPLEGRRLLLDKPAAAPPN